MENASEALFMAFAVLVFVIALTVAINSFSQVKAVSDIVLYSADKTNFYDYQGATGRASQNREVGIETIIPTLYKYYKENYTVLFRQGNYNRETGEFSNVKPLPIYTTPSRYKTPNGSSYLWGKKDGEKDQSTYDTLLQTKYSSYFQSAGGYKEKGSTKIFSFDLEEETLRHEPWTGSYEKAKENLDCLLQGKVYNNPNNNQTYINYKNDIVGLGGFSAKYKNKKFIETIGEYTYSDNQSLSSTATSEDETEAGSQVQIGSTIGSNVSKKKKRIVVFTLINGNVIGD